MLLALPAMQTMFLTDVRLFAGQLNTLLRTNAQTNAAAVAPVSYTHLDVYKRQVRHDAPFQTAMLAD